jgi:hypothetical protein
MFDLKALSLKYSNTKSGFLFLFLIWGITQIAAYFHFGVMMPVDTELYVESAQSILQGNWPQNNVFFYTSYCTLIAVLFLFGLSVKWMILIQIIVSGLALFSIHEITKIISKNNLTAFVACLLYILWFKFQQWNLIVYTDSLFANFAVISLYVLLKVKNNISYLLAFVLIAFTTLLRPMGIGFLFAILSYLLYDNSTFSKIRRVWKLSYLTLFFVFLLFILNGILRGFTPSFLESYANAEIIYPKITLGIDKPEQLYMPNDQHQPLSQLMLFMVQNPYYMFKITFIKAILFLGHIKPYYSIFHNVFIGCFLYPVYFFALRGAKLIPNNKLCVFILVFIGFQVITISLTSENWDGRFLLPILPWVFILSSFGISDFVQKQFRKAFNK